MSANALYDDYMRFWAERFLASLCPNSAFGGTSDMPGTLN